MQLYPKSPTCKIEGKYQFHLKRDDLLHPVLGGNKWRKMAWLWELEGVETIVSYGSLHSNAMAALALVARKKGWRFCYYARLDGRSLAAPRGNLALALAHGMELRPIEELKIPDRNDLASTIRRGSTLIVPEGGRCPEAELGVAQLAAELGAAANVYGFERIFLPSGTGTTALFLQKHLGLKVYTTPCVGDAAYLRAQFAALEPDSSRHPVILEPPRRYRFGRLYKELYDLWNDLFESTRVEFDLLYDPVGFAALMHHDMLGGRLCYIHQGGLGANATMLSRYKAKFATIQPKREGVV